MRLQRSRSTPETSSSACVPRCIRASRLHRESLCITFWRIVSLASGWGECPDSCVDGRAAAGQVSWSIFRTERQHALLPLEDEREQCRLSCILLPSADSISISDVPCSLLRPSPTVISKAIRAERSCPQHRQRPFLQRFKTAVEPPDCDSSAVDHKAPLLALSPPSFFPFTLDHYFLNHTHSYPLQDAHHPLPLVAPTISKLLRAPGSSVVSS